jgi:hypothetical protein
VLRALFHARKLSAPIPLELAGPFVHGSDPFRVGPIERLSAMTSYLDETDVPQDAKMLGDGRLCQAQLGDDLPHRTLARREVFKNASTPGFGNGVEWIRSRRGSWHWMIIFLYRNVSSTSAFRLRTRRSPPHQ